MKFIEYELTADADNEGLDQLVRLSADRFFKYCIIY